MKRRRNPGSAARYVPCDEDGTPLAELKGYEYFSKITFGLSGEGRLVVTANEPLTVTGVSDRYHTEMVPVPVRYRRNELKGLIYNLKYYREELEPAAAVVKGGGFALPYKNLYGKITWRVTPDSFPGGAIITNGAYGVRLKLVSLRSLRYLTTEGIDDASYVISQFPESRQEPYTFTSLDPDRKPPRALFVSKTGQTAAFDNTVLQILKIKPGAVLYGPRIPSMYKDFIFYDAPRLGEMKIFIMPLRPD